MFRWRAANLVESEISVVTMLDAVMDLLATEVISDPEEENDSGGDRKRIGRSNDRLAPRAGRFRRNGHEDLTNERGPFVDGHDTQTNAQSGGACESSDKRPSAEEEGDSCRSRAIGTVKDGVGVDVGGFGGKHDTGDVPK